MSVQVRRRREAASFLSTFVGAQGELLVDTTNNRVQVHDGATPGGWPAAKLADVIGRTTVADVAYTAKASDRTIAITAVTAPRTITLPAATAFPTGTTLTIVDESGACATIPVSVGAAGSDTINGLVACPIATAYGYLALESNGSGKWTIVDAPGVTRTAVADASYTALASDRTIAVISLTAARTITLPAASAYPTGTQLLVVDESGACSTTNQIVLARAGTDTINGASTASISTAYGYLAFASNGSARWTVVDQTPSTSGGTAASRTPVSDANYTAVSTDRLIAYTALTAARTVMLPAASAFPVGVQLFVVDESGACSATNTLTVARAGSDTINGAASASITTAYGYLAVESNGTGKWTLVDQAAVVGAGTGALRYDTAQTLTAGQQAQAVANLGGMLAGFRNRIVNGGMAVDQRNAGTAQTITAGAALAYTVDRFYAYCAGANVTGQRVASVGLYQYQFTGAASVTAIGFGQRIETANSADLAGASAVLSVNLANSLLTTVTWTAYYAGSADSFGTLSSPTRTQIATGTFTVSSTLTKYSAAMSIPSAATTGIEILLSVGAQTSGTWTVGNVQLEAGASATAFERRPIGAETFFCQRYYWPSAAFTGGWGGGTTSITVAYTFPVAMRVAPQLSLLNGSVNGGSALEITVAQHVVSAITANVTNSSGGRADLTTTAAAGTQRPGILEAGTLGFNAEL